MMIVMLGDEVQVINKAHGLLKARMDESARKLRGVELLQLLEQFKPGSAERGYDFLDVVPVVIRLVSAAIR